MLGATIGCLIAAAILNTVAWIMIRKANRVLERAEKRADR